MRDGATPEDPMWHDITNYPPPRPRTPREYEAQISPRVRVVIEENTRAVEGVPLWIAHLDVDGCDAGSAMGGSPRAALGSLIAMIEATTDALPRLRQSVAMAPEVEE
jgi:hypothetical protein